MTDVLIADALLPGFVVAPIVVAAALLAFVWTRAVRKGAMVATLGVTLVGAGLLLADVASGGVRTHFVGAWSPVIAIPFAADAFSALMLTLTLFMTLVASGFAIRAGAADEPYFCPLLLLVTAGVNGALLTADLFNFFVFIELMLVPSYALMVLAHRGMGLRMQVTATRIYVTVNLLTSSILLIGIGLVYAALGTVNLGALAGRALESPVATLGCSVVLLALGVKAAVVPVHGWLGRTYPFMTPTVTTLFASLHTKVAVYALFRLYSLFFGVNETLQTVALVVFVVTMAIGVLGAVGEQDARAILSFHMISQIGYVLLGLALFTPAALAAGVFYLVHNIIAKASLFLSTGAVEMTYGRHTLGEVSGLARREPVTAVVFFVAAMSLAGLPPFSGFVAKYALIAAAFDASQWVVGAAALAVSAFTLLSMLKIWGGMFLGPSSTHDEELDPRIGTRLIGPAAVLALATVVLGVAAEPLLHLAQTIAAALLDPAAYVRAVTGA